MHSEASRSFEKVLEKKIEKAIDKKAEYAVTILINIVLLSILDNLLEWLPFLTSSFGSVLPLFYFSYVATIIANLIFFVNDSKVFKIIVKATLNLFSIVVMISVYYIFPFDFSAYTTDWNLIVRIFLLLAIFGTAVGTTFDIAKICRK